MVISKEVIYSRLKKLEICLQKLRKIGKIKKSEFLKDSVLQDVADRNLQVAAECVLDIGNHVIAEQGFSLPQDNEDIIKILVKNSVVGERLGDDLKGLGGFRNILVHDYLGLDYNRIYEYISSKLKIFEKFAKDITVFIEK